jgi:hypothetical protein
MKEVYANGWRSFKLLMDFQNYTNKERILKGFLMPFLLIINAALFILTGVFYLIERLFANVFRVFIKIQSSLFQKRMLISEGKKRLMTFLAVVIFIFFSPFILVYYLSMGLKTLGKVLMKKLVFKMDFTRHYTVTDVYVFDDANVHTTQKVSGMMKDLNQSQALGQALESIMNEQNNPKSRRR